MVASRRTMLQVGAGMAVLGTGTAWAGAGTARAAGPGAAFLGAPGTAAPQAAGPTALTGELSPNGWPVNTRANLDGGVWTRPVPGNPFELDLFIGDAETILVHVVRRFSYEIDALVPGEVVAFREPSRLHGYELNHASGTAVDIRPGHYPPGARGGFYPHQLAVVRDVLADCEGVVRWGGDFETPDEAHFQIDLPPGDERVHAVAEKIRGWNRTPGQGAGTLPDPANATRLRSARRLERLQSP